MKFGKALVRRFSSASAHDPELGLCGLQYLRQPKDFGQLVKSSILSCNKLRQTLSCNKEIAATNPKDTLLILDQISNELCKVLDSAEFVRNVHENEGFQKAAQEAFDEMSDFMHELNCDTLLYKRLDEIMHNRVLWPSAVVELDAGTETDSVHVDTSANTDMTVLSEEEQTFADVLYREFISEGIHLAETPGAQAALGELKATISALETDFMRNINARPDPNNGRWLSIGPFGDSKEELENYRLLRNYLENIGLPQAEEQVGSDEFIPGNNGSRTLYCIANKTILSTLLGSVTSSDIRKQVYCHLVDEPSDNAAVLSGLIAERHRYARFLGHSCFSEKYLQDKILSTPGEVMGFLRSFGEDIRPRSERELQDLTRYFHDNCREEQRQDSRSSDINSTAQLLNIWDVGYAIRHARANDGYGLDFNFTAGSRWISRSGSPVQAEWRSSPLQRMTGYLHFERCLSSLEMLCDELFGVQMRRVPLSAAEGWEASSGGREPHLMKYELIEDNGRGASLGSIYFDLFRRHNKFSNSAHFTVQCGCSNSDTDRLLSRFPSPSRSTSSSIRNWFNGSSGSTDSSTAAVRTVASKAEEIAYQLPSVVLVLNLSSDHLSLDDLETLYHEFGHALHSLLSRTTFQYLSGTRGSTDFIEIPSHLLEYFSRSQSVLTSWAQTSEGERLPSGLAEEALARKELFSTLELQTQLLYSVADQYLHGAEMGEIISANGYSGRDFSGGGGRGIYRSILEGLCRSQQEFTVLPLAQTNGYGRNGTVQIPGMLPLSHAHLVNYSGGYYTYLYARQWAAQIWCNRFQDNPLSRDSGMYLWHNMLRFGASKDKLTMLKDLGSRPGSAPEPLSTTYYLRSRDV